ncbi:MAG TPA: hypothetical protein VHG09_05285 [Longimicrobiales bacterium]|nr:hypothetical protein [Longimicrobiales bacterium]
MRRRTTALRVGLVMIACATGLSACRDNGLEDRNLPLEEAQNRVNRYPVYERSGDSPALAMGGRHWIRSQTEEKIAPHVLVPVGTVEGTQLFARRGADAPYSRLWAQVSEDRWTPYLPLN